MSEKTIAASRYRRKRPGVSWRRSARVDASPRCPMPISVTCPNGHSLVAQDQYAGAKATCPTCRTVVDVPPLFPPPAAVPVAQVAAPEEEEFKLAEIAALPSPLAAPLLLPPAAAPVAQVAGPELEEFELVQEVQKLSQPLSPPLPPPPAAEPVAQVAAPEEEECEVLEE